MKKDPNTANITSMKKTVAKKALVLGAGGFIGSHLVTFLKEKGFYVEGVDIKRPEFSKTKADKFIKGDLRESGFVKKIFTQKFDGYIN